MLSEAERTAALYSLLQHSTQVQIRFFITVLQQMAKADPMTALLSPSAGGSMQSQMEAKLAQMGLKSPGLKSNMPSSPSARNFSGAIGAGNRQSLAVEPSSSSFLSPDSAAVGNNSDAAATLAQQRAKLKANAQHRISAPALAGAAGSNVWGGSGANSLGQVAERLNDAETSQEITIGPSPSSVLNSARPKSTDFSGLLRSPRVSSGADTDALENQFSPMASGNWASMVNTPKDLMFDVQQGGGQNLDAAASKLASWQVGNSGGRFSLDDAKKFRRTSKSNGSDNVANAIYGDDGNAMGGSQPYRNGRNPNLAVNQPNNGLRSPALSNVSSGRFGPGSDAGDAGLAAMNMNAFGMGMPSPGMANMEFLQRLQAQMRHASPMMLQQMQQLNMMGMNPAALNGLGGMNGMGMPGDANQQMQALLAAQMAAAGVSPFMQPGMQGFDMNALSPQAQAAMFGGMQQGRTSRGTSRMGGTASGNRSNNGRDGSTAGRGGEKDEDVDPKVLEDVPMWLRSLRLHKYTPNFEGMRWQDMVMMDEAALEAKGVAALGARRKMLKTFEAVRNKMGLKMPGETSGESAAGAADGGEENA